jgi:hypothetical protein
MKGAGMNEAPEKIVADTGMVPDENGGIAVWKSWGVLSEYRRADLPPTDAEVMAHPKVAALVAAAGVMFDASRDPGCSPGDWERATISLGAALAALKGGE